MTLYELTGVALELQEMLLDEQIDEKVVADTLESIGADQKLESYCRIIKNYKADISALDNEIDKLKAKKESVSKAVTRMEDAVLTYLTAAGITKAPAGIFKVSTRKTERVEVTSMDLLPSQYKTEKKSVSADKMAIKEAIKSGEIVIGAELVAGTSLTIK